MNSAHLSAIVAFSLWGFFPIYWKFFDELPAWDLFGHRLFWSFVTLWLIVAAKKKSKVVCAIRKDKRTALMLLLSALLISTNWLLYIYAVNEGRILEASMGYFLNTLINTFMGWLILKERLRSTQWPAILLAFFAIILLALTTDLNHFPWIAIILALTFALYGLIRKLAKVGSLEGLTFETSILILPVLIYWIFYMGSSPMEGFKVMSPMNYSVLALSGIVTTLPLILFAYSAKRLPLQVLGFIQYLSPSFKFLCGLFIFHEALSDERLNAFIIIWVALAYYTAESFWNSQKGRFIPPTE
jgi:chloramphenicol-sensitive protein RarD